MLFQQQDVGPGVVLVPSMSVESAYHMFFTTAAELCLRPQPITDIARAVCAKVLEQLHARMNNFVRTFHRQGF